MTQVGQTIICETILNVAIFLKITLLVAEIIYMVYCFERSLIIRGMLLLYVFQFTKYK
jgi:hypothetical protein